MTTQPPNETPSAAPAAKRMPRAIKALLFGSLALNLIVVGLVVGAISRGGPPDRSSDRPQDVSIPFTRALDREDRRSIGKDIRRNLREIEDDRAPRVLRRKANAEALIVLRAEPFDPDAFVSVMQMQAGATQAMAQIGARALADHLAGMDQSERLDYADRVESAFKSRKRRMPKK